MSESKQVEASQFKPSRPLTAQTGKTNRVQNKSKLVGEDYFRVLKENKEIQQHEKKKAGIKKGEIGFESISKMSKLSHDKEELPLEEMDEDQILKHVQLPSETLYLIDKVVRQRSKQGPIGVDNSELINIELEEQFRQRNQHLQQLVGGKGQEESEDKENIEQNDRLMERLTKAANQHNQTGQQYDKSKMTEVNSKSRLEEKSGGINAVSHAEWYRRKEHEERLKEKLIEEAKKDAIEQMKIKRLEQIQKKQEKEMTLAQWEEKKRREENKKKNQKWEQEERERMTKQIKSEQGYRVFKEWLKHSLIKQKEEIVQNRIREQQKKEEEEKEKKAKANMKIMAKIAFKEWKENKREEARQRAKIERMQRKQQMFEEQEKQEEQIQKGEVMLAYGLNKNLKKLQSRPKSAKPRKKNKKEYQL